MFASDVVKELYVRLINNALLGCADHIQRRGSSLIESILSWPYGKYVITIIDEHPVAPPTDPEIAPDDPPPPQP
jgi:hypothetical protein